MVAVPDRTHTGESDAAHSVGPKALGTAAPLIPEPYAVDLDCAGASRHL